MKARAAIVLSLCAFATLFCTKGPTSPSSNSRNSITMKGVFPALQKKAGLAGKISAASAEARTGALDPSQVANVIAFCGTDGFMISTVTGGSFNVVVNRLQPIALLFVGTNGNNLGYLSLGNGFESIPLTLADSNVSSIDLQTLAAAGNIIEPGHNPIGAEIPMTASDITSYVFSNGSMGSVVKSPDVDGDGIVDVAAGKFYRYTMRYPINAGNFGTKLTPTLANPVVINSYIFEVKITDPDMNYPDSVYFNGPAGSGIESATSWLTQSFGPPESRSYCAPFITNPSIPPPGTYVVRYKTKTLTFTMPSQAEITKYLPIPVPTVILNSDSTIHMITWEYRLSDGSTTIDPKVSILNIGMQIGIDIGNGPPGVQKYSVYNLSPETTEDMLTDQSIKWNSVLNILMGYLDVFGNQIQVIWDRP